MNLAEEKILLERIIRFNNRLSKFILTDPIKLEMQFAKSDGEIKFKDRLSLDFKPINIGEQWGAKWEVGWFKVSVSIPKKLQNKKLVLQIDLGGEGLVYDSNGNIMQGISSGSVFESDFSRDIVDINKLSIENNMLELWIEASACGLFGIQTDPDPLPGSELKYGHYEAIIKEAQLCCFDQDKYNYWLDLETVRGMLTVLPEASVRRARLLTAISESLDLHGRGESIKVCRQRLNDELNRPASASELTAVAVGHAHIDTAWLWPIRETIRKCARTFSSQLALIEKYPDYVFGASQPQHYKFVKDHYPELYQRIKTAIKNGQWEVQGGMWVEADCNLISGESMIRQILHGKNFFMDEFGIDVNNLWLPDVFGYSPAMPQILLKSGIQYFLTQKISWNQYNKFPHHTFNWQGIDGSQVLTHFPPEDTYNSSLRAESLMRGAAQFNERGVVDKFLNLFGVGDGGGGPKEEHIEFGLRCKNNESVPKVEFDKSSAFFEHIDNFKEKLPTWVGELYLELHRGTLTTQAKTKKWNRLLDYKLRDTEMLFSSVDLEKYPAVKLKELWELLLMNQFHDILPGSSINSVYQRSNLEYEHINNEINKLQKQAIELIGNSDSETITIFNPASYKFSGIVPLPDDFEASETFVTIDPLQFITLKRSAQKAISTTSDNQLILENDLIRYEFNKDGCLISAYDKEADRFISISGNPGNLFSLYEDYPNNWDAWDIDRTYENTLIANHKSISQIKRISSALKQTLITNLSVSNSTIQQEIILINGSKRLDFKTKVHWQESHRMLRVAFPVNILANEASFDIQYGYVKRPTHRNSSWDLAKFEVVGHRYADLSEPDFGVALLNDCKYGHKILGQTIDLCLLRSPCNPDPDADRGEHEFTYSLLPHQHDLVRSNVMSEASALNHPPLIINGINTKLKQLPVSISGTGVTIETIKKAENENCLIIRVVETNGSSTRAILSGDENIIKIEECDLMEWQTIGSPVISNKLELSLSPFEIKTYKLWTE